MQSERSDVVAVVLAAGRGRRIGGPKALLSFSIDGVRLPLAAAHARRFAFCRRVLVVTRADIAEVLRREVVDLGAELIVSRAPDELGPAGSLSAAAGAIDGAGSVLVTPVDCPPVSRAALDALLGAFSAAPDAVAARPLYRGRRGHPVVLGSPVWGPYRHHSRPLRDVLREWRERVIDVPVDDPGVLADIDTPQDLAAAPRFFGPGDPEV